MRHAGYIAKWIELLRADKRAIFTACSKDRVATTAQTQIPAKFMILFVAPVLAIARMERDLIRPTTVNGRWRQLALANGELSPRPVSFSWRLRVLAPFRGVICGLAPFEFGVAPF